MAVQDRESLIGRRFSRHGRPWAVVTGGGLLDVPGGALEAGRTDRHSGDVHQASDLPISFVRQTVMRCVGST